MSVEQTSMNQLITDNIDVWTSTVKTKSASGRGSSKKRELYGVKKLRELILELAVRGKLVAQDPTDEPASVLLERISEEKAQLIKDKKIKKPKKLSEISDDEKSFVLPNGWEWAHLQDLTTYVQRGKGPKYAESGSVQVVSQKCVQNSGFDLTPARYVTDESLEKYQPERFLQDHDILWNSTGTGTVGRANVINNIPLQGIVADSHVTVIRPSLYSRFLWCFIMAPGIHSSILTDHYYALVSGSTNQVELNTSSVISVVVPVAPLEEQHRIVAKVNELMTLCDQLEQQTETSIEAHQVLVTTLLDTLTNSADADELMQNWQRISEHFDTLFTTEASIDQLKQTILQLAVMGKLVPQDSTDEPASKLLERISDEKAQLIKDKKIKKQKALPPITDDEKPFGLPSGWEWCSLGELVNIRGGKRLPKGQALTTEPTPYVYIRVSDMKNGTISTTDLHYLSKDTQEQIKNYIITSDDIYMTIVGATIGKCGLVPEELSGVNLTENAARLSPYLNLDKNYLHQFLSSHFAQEQFIDKTKQVGVQKMALNRLSSTKVPLPPIEHQKRIVSRIEDLTLFCDQLKAHLKESQITQLYLTDAIVERGL